MKKIYFFKFYEVFVNIDYLLGNRDNFNKFLKGGEIQVIVLDYIVIKLEINVKLEEVIRLKVRFK